MNLWHTIEENIPRPCKEGKPFIAIAAAITVLFFILDWEFLATVMLAITVWVVYFFRDPDRFVPEGEGLIVSPADGVISMITEAVPPAALEMGEEPLTRISVFLNVFNVHVNRVPTGGTITKMHYHPGKFVNAALDKASEDNERHEMKVTAHNGKEIGFVQIAGLVARRIVWHIAEGDELQTGERFGMIRFGSRMDVYLPKGINPLVADGQVAVAGETIFADMNGAQHAPRVGVKR